MQQGFSPGRDAQNRPAYTDPEYVAEGQHVFICNITEQGYFTQPGIPGGRAIIGCAPGEAYALTEVAPVVVRVETGQGQEPGHDAFGHPGKWGQKTIAAMQIAGDMVGTHSSENLERLGVFIIPGGRSYPSKAEMEKATTRLRETYGRLAQEADLLWSRKAGNPDITDLMRRAAKWLGLDRPWAYMPREMVTCSGCGERVSPNIAIHKACGAVLNRERAIELGIIQPVPVAAKE